MQNSMEFKLSQCLSKIKCHLSFIAEVIELVRFNFPAVLNLRIK